MEFGESVRSYKIIQKALNLERPKHVNLIDVYIRYQLRLINLTEFVTKKKKMGKKYFCRCRYFLLFLIIIYYVNKVFRNATPPPTPNIKNHPFWTSYPKNVENFQTWRKFFLFNIFRQIFIIFSSLLLFVVLFNSFVLKQMSCICRVEI